MTDKTKEVLRLALEALEASGANWIALERKAKAAIREALAPQPAPVEEPRKQQQIPKSITCPFCESEHVPGWLHDYNMDRDAQGEQSAIKQDLTPEQLAQPQQEPVAIEYWLQDTMESGRWVTTDNMAKATAEKMLSGEYGDVYPQGRIVEPSPPASKPWVGLTDEDISKMPSWIYSPDQDGMTAEEGLEVFARAIEAKLKEKNSD